MQKNSYSIGEKESGLWLSAGAALLLICLALVMSTWQTIVMQRETEEAHLRLSSQAMLLAVEQGLSRLPPPLSSTSLSASIKSLFHRLAQEGDVLFAGISIGEAKELLSASGQDAGQVILPDPLASALERHGQWDGRMRFAGGIAYVAAKRIAAPKNWHAALADAPQGPYYLALGLDAEKQLKPYSAFRRNALFQSAYIFIAALALWALTVSYLNSRRKARKTKHLEIFNSALLDAMPDGLILLRGAEKNWQLCFANPAAFKLLACLPEDLLGKSMAALPPAVAACLQTPGGHAPSTSWQAVTWHGLDLELRAVPLLLENGGAFIVLLRDRTQLKQLERSLASAEKLAAIGSLAAGVAHEVRNPLSALRGFAQYFAKKLQGVEPDEHYARIMMQEADRLNRVIADLLYLAKPKTFQKETLDLQALYTEIQQLLQRDLENSGLLLAKRLDTPTLQADRNAVKQCLLHLLLNSLAAFPEKEIRDTPAGQAVFYPAALAKTHRQAPDIIVSSGSVGTTVWLEVSDHGSGMDNETLRRACEPFFSGRKDGSGLGLALLERFMHEHNGTLYLSSAPGQGTKVRLSFPQEKL